MTVRLDGLTKWTPVELETDVAENWIGVQLERRLETSSSSGGEPVLKISEEQTGFGSSRTTGFYAMRQYMFDLMKFGSLQSFVRWEVS
jgi:hypothetical protein